MRLLIFVSDALILFAIFFSVVYFFALGYDKGRREVKKGSKPARKPAARTRKGSRRA